MKKVFQTQLHTNDSPGNCLRAAIASVLEIDIDSIPKFEDMGDNPDWFVEFRKWSRESGYGIVNVYPQSLPPSGYSLAVGLSPRHSYIYTHHCVVTLNGEIVHDPHPDGTGLENIDRYWCFEEEPVNE